MATKSIKKYNNDQGRLERLTNNLLRSMYIGGNLTAIKDSICSLIKLFNQRLKN